ncbi:MAG: pyruvate, phosphate dikinase [Candidatus Gracilibacteria bacterium]|nr:pyruvate, phosphate dikinase [Candidatus Gracilibacteria bacterium]
MQQYIYHFDEGSKDMKGLLGGKGANLAEMTTLGLQVPPGFTLTTEYCIQFLKNESHAPNFKEKIHQAVEKVEQQMGEKFGDADKPLLFSVRSGARVSMPGMMDTVLNLGLNDTTIQGLIKQTSNERFAYDAYRRFINMYGNVVMGVSHHHFEAKFVEFKKSKGYEDDLEMTPEDLRALVGIYKETVKEHCGNDFPDDPWDQLQGALDAVFQSWNNKRAITYRNINKIAHDWGTAVNVQTMVFGNMGETSGTGVAFTRDPSTGEKGYFGEYLMNAQGEDVVAGIRTPKQIADLKNQMPEVYKELTDIFDKLEAHYKDMQDIEFTIEKGKLYILQTRTGKRTGKAAVRIALDMIDEGLIDKKTAILRVDANSLEPMLHPTVDPKADSEVISKGLPASPGAACGRVVFTADDAVSAKQNNEKCVLVRHETSPEDIAGMNSAEGILTSTGGMTSHAAVVARGMGKCCVAGAGDIKINYAEKKFICGDVEVKEGDIITICGTSGEVMLGEVATIPPQLDEYFEKLMGWADEIRTIKVRTNAETANDAQNAINFGAEGIGLCRTEHMFFDQERILHVREMILSDTHEQRIKAIDKLLPYQKDDFIKIFKIMDDLPVTIRLLDPPLHEFVPHDDEEIEKVAAELGMTSEEVKEKIVDLEEVNPMLGHRGCRLGVSYPELSIMQAKAIIMAALEVQKDGKKVIPEIMVPLVSLSEEFTNLEKKIRKHADKLIASSGIELEYKVGTMIEIPRACIVADRIAEKAEFFSFGTNDLTQMAFGFSRDDAGKFLGTYQEKGLIKSDPFSVLDQEGVGALMKIAVEKAKSVRKDIKLGICGEHGGEPSSVEFCINLGFDYVSCSPFRVPIARLAAAQAELKKND